MLSTHSKNQYNNVLLHKLVLCVHYCSLDPVASEWTVNHWIRPAVREHVPWSVSAEPEVGRTMQSLGQPQRKLTKVPSWCPAVKKWRKGIRAWGKTMCGVEQEGSSVGWLQSPPKENWCEARKVSQWSVALWQEFFLSHERLTQSG